MKAKKKSILEDIRLRTLLEIKEQKIPEDNNYFKVYENLYKKNLITEYKFLHKTLEKKPKCLTTMAKILFFDNMLTIIKAKQ